MYALYEFKRARNCIEILVRKLCIKEIFIPYYLCDVVRHTLFKENCIIKYYHIDDNFMPAKPLPKESFIIYPNYFGICSENVKILTSYYPNLIVDNAHAFYEPPSGLACFNSGIKFDYGERAYLWIRDEKSEIYDIEIDLSKKQQRLKGFLDLHKKYGGINQLDINTNKECIPFCYPLLCKTEAEADKIAQTLEKQGFTIYRYWNNLPKSYNEYKLYSRLVPIPIA